MSQSHRPRDEASDWDGWDQPGQTASLLLIGAACLGWWAASLVIGPIVLAMEAQRRDDDTWPLGETA